MIKSIDNEKKTLLKYRTAIRDILASRKYMKSGTGIRKYKQRKRNAYKIENGKYGGLLINVPKLVNELIVEVKKGGNNIYENKADKSLIELLTKRFNPKKKIFRKCNTNF